MSVYLASTSPRRKELLSQLLSDFIPVSPQVEEKEYPHLTPKEKAVRLSKDKCIGAVNLLRKGYGGNSQRHSCGPGRKSAGKTC